MPWSTTLTSWRITFFISWILTYRVTEGSVLIDDTNPYITYSGSWLTETRSGHLQDTAHYTNVKGSSATLSFTGAVRVQLVGQGIINPTLDSGVGIIFDGVSISANLFRDPLYYLPMYIWESSTIDSNVRHTLECVKTSADGGGMDLYIDAFLLTMPDGVTSSPLLTPGPTTTTSTTQGPSATAPSSSSSPSSSGSSSSSSTTSVVVVANNSTLANVSLALPINSDNPSSPTNNPAQIASVTEAPGVVTKDNGLSTAAKTGIAFGAIAFICLSCAIFFLLGRRKRYTESIEHQYPFPANESDLQAGHPDPECGMVDERMLHTSRPMQGSLETDVNSPYPLRSETSTDTGSILKSPLDASGPPPYSLHFDSSNS